MRTYLRVLVESEEALPSADLEKATHDFVSRAPGVKNVESLTPHVKGGYSVIVERDEELPGEFWTYFEGSGFLLVI